MSDRIDRALYAAALLLGVLPLWVARQLPMVDLPQHLHLISVLHRLDDPTTLYPQFFDARNTFTPYLGYYYLVSALNWLLPLETANRLFLSAYVAGLPLSLAFLLRALDRPVWPSLLALPFAYGDSFAWGFVNYCASLPLALLCCGLFVRTLTHVPRRRMWGAWLAVCLVAVLIFHVQAFFFLALGLPWLLFTTRVPEDAEARGWRARLRPRLPVLAGVAPGVVLFLGWAALRLGEPADIAPGQPWKAWGPLLSEQNLAFKPFAQNREELFQVLANLFHDGSDRWALYAVGAVALAGLGLSLVFRVTGSEGAVARFRLLGLGLIALALYFLLPFDIRGYIYYLNTRYAHLAAALLVASVPLTPPALQRYLLWASAACALMLGLVLGRGFRAFSREAAEWDGLVAATAPKPRVMGLIYDTGSRVVRFPVFLHGAAVLARARGGVTNFSFALTPHSPLRYRDMVPPTFPSEWRPGDFDYASQGTFYDHFLVRGVHPSRIFGPRLQSELAVAAHEGDSWLVRRR
ncbi:hypothetical protein [Hyalangium rubrum]|uniref:Membrane protein 6-pyruvoyl-tetrahydropterin synthase-related domain-containing protein n=1 Tax=Hyalangium rubrum TaxID=3103134 RepID=A0ABU5GXR6_9BACT|nr:hypothetical protein [Hyalangium sp. s54d21]MDY7225283.1 hypothetical protein [Hyalangium sp. s54d21]